VLSAALSLALAASPGWSHAGSEEIGQTLTALHARPLDQRLLSLGARFLGTPYAHSPLGEGEGVDPDPRFRLDQVDCLTFVETVMALALSDTPEDVLHVLDSIRYRGRPEYTARNHLMEAEWLPSNAAKGFIRDVTPVLGGPQARASEKVIGPEAWASTTGKALALPPEARPVGKFPLGVLPVQAVPDRAASWPSGTLLLLVREDAPWRVTRISHLGFVLQRDGRTYLRHATRGWKDGVVDEELGHLLARHAHYSWKVVGVSLWEVRDPRPWTAEAPAAK
jgi:Protein of unknown function (DUF1460)